MNNKFIISGVVLAVLVVGIGLADWYVGSVVSRDEAVQRAAELEAGQGSEGSERAEAFEDVLNTLLRDVQGKVQAYKRSRQVLIEVVRPVNLAQAENITENAAMMERIIPDLRGKMDGILLAFERADERVNAILVDADAQTQASLLASWRQTRDRHARDYIAFFEIEEQVIDAYSVLMAFYQQGAGRFSYDEVAGQLVFEDDALRLREADLKLDIKELAIAQAQLFVQRKVDSGASGKVDVPVAVPVDQ